MERAERGQQELTQRFSLWLAEQMADHRDLTTRQIAARTGVLDGDVQDWLAARRMPTGQECRLIGAFFGLTDAEAVSLCGDPSGQG